jgi:hypothetical protein
MQYDPRQPHEHRYVKDAVPLDPKLEERITQDCLMLNRALGYDLNTVEFAVRDGVPYAIDFLNPAPDADYHSVGAENFTWIVNAVADLAIRKALEAEPVDEYRWSSFLNAMPTNGKGRSSGAVKTAAKRSTKSSRK